MRTRQLFTLASLALLLLAAATGCTDDHIGGHPNLPADTGLPVDFSSISIASSSANGGGSAGSVPTIDVDGFYPGDVIHARLAYGSTTQEARLTNTGWSYAPVWEADKAIYWQSTDPTTPQTLTLSRGSEGDFTLPDNMEGNTTMPDPNGQQKHIANYTLHDRLFHSYTGPMLATAPSWELKHRMAQIVVTLTRDEGSTLPTGNDLSFARVSMPLPVDGHFDGVSGIVSQRSTGTGGTAGAKQVMFLKGNAQGEVYPHFAVALPGSTGTRIITITIPADDSSTGKEQTYQYTAPADITLEAGHSRVFRLSLGTRVSALSISTTEWQEAAQGPGVKEALIIEGVTEGGLSARLPSPKGSSYGHVRVSGALNDDDYKALNAFLNGLPSTVSLEIDITGGSREISVSAFIQCNKLGAVVLKGITKIGAQAFWESSLTSITLPEGLWSIGMGAFSYCQDLKSITLPSSVTSLGDEAFIFCTNLTSIVLPEKLDKIGDHAFSVCTSLKSIALPSSVTQWGMGIFLQSGLTSITLPEGMKKIPSDSFAGCKDLQTITLPSTITTVGGMAFSACTSLKSITLPSTITTVGNMAFSGCTSLKSITIPSSVTQWSTSIFQGSGLTSITLPEGMKEIPNGTFQYCDSLQTITLPSTITTVGEYAFYGSGLTSIILPEGVTKISNQAFMNCAELQKVAVNIDAVIKAGQDAFAGTHADKELFDYSNYIASNPSGNPIFGTTWKAVHFGYLGSGDKLDPDNYNEHHIY